MPGAHTDKPERRLVSLSVLAAVTDSGSARESRGPSPAESARDCAQPSGCHGAIGVIVLVTGAACHGHESNFVLSSNGCQGPVGSGRRLSPGRGARPRRRPAGRAVGPGPARSLAGLSAGIGKPRGHGYINQPAAGSACRGRRGWAGALRLGQKAAGYSELGKPVSQRPGLGLGHARASPAE